MVLVAVVDTADSIFKIPKWRLAPPQDWVPGWIDMVGWRGDRAAKALGIDLGDAADLSNAFRPAMSSDLQQHVFLQGTL